ncbi:MAG: hypothetical protein N2B05_11380, partial [Gemmatimonadales bacterium]
SLSLAALQWPEAAGTLAVARVLLVIPAIAATIRLPRIASRLRFQGMDRWRRRARLASLAGIIIAVSALVTAAVSF